MPALNEANIGLWSIRNVRWCLFEMQHLGQSCSPGDSNDSDAMEGSSEESVSRDKAMGRHHHAFRASPSELTMGRSLMANKKVSASCEEV